jgi:hypothetical protein
VPTGNIGTINTPESNVLTPITQMLKVENVPKQIAKTNSDPKEITLNVSRYFLYLSSKNPKTKELRTPVKTNIPPKRLTALDGNFNPSKKGSKTTPSPIKTLSRAEKVAKINTKFLFLIAAATIKQKFIYSGS